MQGASAHLLLNSTDLIKKNKQKNEFLFSLFSPLPVNLFFF